MNTTNVSGLKENRKASLLTHVAWSPDDRRVIACYGDEPPRIIDTRTREVLGELALGDDLEPEKSSVKASASSAGFRAAWSPSGDHIALARKKEIHLLDGFDSGKYVTYPVAILPPKPQAYLKAFRVDPMLSRLPVVGSEDEQSRRLEKYLSSLSIEVETLVWLAEGNVIGVGTRQGAYLWHPDTGARVQSIRPHPYPGQLLSPVFSPDAKYLAGLFVPDRDVISDLFWNFNKALNIARPVLSVFNVETGQPYLRYQGDDLPESDCRLYWSCDGRSLAWTYDNKVVVFDVLRQSGRELLKSQERRIGYLDWSPNSNRLAVQDSSTGIAVYDTASGVRLTAYRGTTWKVSDVGDRVFAWSNKGDTMVVGGTRYDIDIWRVQ